MAIEIIVDGQVINTVTTEELFTLAIEGTIDPETTIRVNGKTGKARQIRGIKFLHQPKTASAIPSPLPVPQSQESHPGIRPLPASIPSRMIPDAPPQWQDQTEDSTSNSQNSGLWQTKQNCKKIAWFLFFIWIILAIIVYNMRSHNITLLTNLQEAKNLDEKISAEIQLEHEFIPDETIHMVSAIRWFFILFSIVMFVVGGVIHAEEPVTLVQERVLEEEVSFAEKFWFGEKLWEGWYIIGAVFGVIFLSLLILNAFGIKLLEP